MAVDIFLKVDGVDGEATDVNHKDEIEVVSWSWGAAHAVGPSPGGSGTGKAHISDVAVVKHVDKASPTLFRHCLKGTHIPTVVLAQRKSGAGNINFLTITLNEVFITSVTDASDGGRPTESVSLAFGKVTYTYVPLKPNGQPDAPVTLRWNVKTNQEF
jgi:type VI secretion system secreted protein Hcp